MQRGAERRAKIIKNPRGQECEKCLLEGKRKRSLLDGHDKSIYPLSFRGSGPFAAFNLLSRASCHRSPQIMSNKGRNAIK